MSIDKLSSQPRSQRSLVLAINAGALVALTASLAHWTWSFMLPPSLATTQVITENAPTLVRPLDIQPLLMAQLFGKEAIVAKEASAAEIQPIKLNLILTGIIGVKDAGLAIISVDNQPQEPFVVGQTITGDAILQAVYPDRVTIMRNGVTENLLLDPTAAGTPSLPFAPQLPIPLTRPAAPETLPHRNFVNRDALRDKIRTIDTSKQLAFAPVTGGVLVLQGQKANVLENLGVQEADVVRSVNGQNLKTSEDVMRVYQSLLSAHGSAPVQIEIIRHGKPLTLQYHME